MGSLVFPERKSRETALAFRALPLRTGYYARRPSGVRRRHCHYPPIFARWHASSQDTSEMRMPLASFTPVVWSSN